jgi:DNA-binding NarL/FixJ family response regulator
MKTNFLPTQRIIPTLLIALSDKLKAELIASLESKKLFKVVNIMTDGERLFENLETQKPDYLLIDTELPNGGGLGFLKKLDRIRPSTKVIVYSSSVNPDFLKVFLSSPALGFIQQGCGISEFTSCIKKVFEGKRMVFSQISDFVSNTSLALDENPDNDLYDLTKLTEREMDIWELLKEGKSEKEMAEILFLSTSTIRTHKNKISDKLNLKGKKKLSKVALSH